MLTVSLPIEILRTKPRLIFWLAVCAQTLLWLVVPSLFYSAPPGDLANLIAAGLEHGFSAAPGPPLAPWLADGALRLAGGHMAGVYLLSQICILVACWALFQLGSAIAGERHAALAVLLMTAISVFTIGSPDFGPDILMLPLWALALLFFWRACLEQREFYWFAMLAAMALMLLVAPLAVVLILSLVALVLIDPRARAGATTFAGGVAAFILACMLLAAFAAYSNMGSGTSVLPRALTADSLKRDALDWLRLVGLIAVAHTGAAILIVIAFNLTGSPRANPVAITRAPVHPSGRAMVYFLAIVPLLAATLFAAAAGQPQFKGLTPLLMLSTLAVVIAAGDVIMLHHQRLLSSAWLALLLMPPLLAMLGVLLLPAAFGVDLKVAQPANEMARFFTDSFERRTGRPLQLVGGDARLASLVSLASRRRPLVLRNSADTATSPDLARKGAVIIWRATDSVGTPPADVRARFPDIVPEVPRAFERALPGRAPLLRVGWGLIRPRAEPQATQ